MRIKNPFLHYSIMTLIFGVAIATLFTHTLFHNFFHESGSQNVIPYQNCQSIGKTTTINYTNKGFNPSNVTIMRCSQVDFKNATNELIDPAFGEHPNHIDYKGFTEKALKSGAENSFVAHTSGTFIFHDHLHEQFGGVLTIK